MPVFVSYGENGGGTELIELPGDSEMSSGKSSSASPTMSDCLFGVALPLLGLVVYPGGGVLGSEVSDIELVLL